MDAYKLLGVNKDSTKEEVKAAFRQKAKLYHPDINKSPNANQLFTQLKLAFDAALAKAPTKARIKAPAFTENKEKIFRVLDVNQGVASIMVMKEFAEGGGWIYCMVKGQEFRLFLEPTDKTYITMESSNLIINIVVE